MFSFFPPRKNEMRTSSYSININKITVKERPGKKPGPSYPPHPKIS